MSATLLQLKVETIGRSAEPGGGDPGLRGPSSWRVPARDRIARERAQDPPRPRNLDWIVFVVTHTLESLSHDTVLRRPARLSLAAAKEEALRAVLASAVNRVAEAVMIIKASSLIILMELSQKGIHFSLALKYILRYIIRHVLR
jgi:hypothetical protein